MSNILRSTWDLNVFPRMFQQQQSVLLYSLNIVLFSPSNLIQGSNQCVCCDKKLSADCQGQVGVLILDNWLLIYLLALFHCAVSCWCGINWKVQVLHSIQARKLMIDDDVSSCTAGFTCEKKSAWRCIAMWLQCSHGAFKSYRKAAFYLTGIYCFIYLFI